ncbi:MAG: TfoX/Sxy family protein [Streptosporangiaceae bacterium]
MTFDQALAERTRAAPIAAGRSEATEKKMFGGLAFLVGGTMCCGVRGADLLVRVGSEAGPGALAEPAARPFEMGQRGPSAGFILIGPDGTATDEALATWVDRALTFVVTLPAKA